MFKFKDNIKDIKYQSLAIYKIPCNTCGKCYIGKTMRILTHRINEHNNVNKESAIQTHKREFPSHNIDANNIRIIDKADNNYKLLLKEMMHISLEKPELNIQHALSYKNKHNRQS